MKKQSRRLIFLLKSNRLSLRREREGEKVSLSARQTVPSPRWPPKDEQGAPGRLSTVFSCSFLPSLHFLYLSIHAPIHSLGPSAHELPSLTGNELSL